MKIKIALKGVREHRIIEAEKIEILDLSLEGTNYKQIRIYKKGSSKSEYIKSDLIQFIKEI
ncbi:MAG: hypothetical protein ACRDDY_06015 [Clostridium sp.]|uniref:hypothetical protein n=1 Tax=Clostridium sp. TaxID=1506 RepID=UPI003EE61AE6